MGNERSKPSTVPDKTKKDVPISFEALYKLNNTYLNYHELGVALEYAKSVDDIQNPYIIIISAKPGGTAGTFDYGKDSDYIFDRKDSDNEMLSEILKKGNHSIIHQKTHKNIKLQLQDITKTEISAIFDGVVVILLCIVQLHDMDPDENENQLQTLKFYYDIDKEKRHVDKLKKDIVYRLDEGQQRIYVHYYETAVIARIDSGKLKPRPPPKNAHIAKKIAGIRIQKQEEKKQRQKKSQNAKQLLSNFGIPAPYIDDIIANLQKELLLDVEDWEYFYDDEQYLVDTIGVPSLYCETFKKQYLKQYVNDTTDLENEIIGNERIWRKHMKSVARSQGKSGGQKRNVSNNNEENNENNKKAPNQNNNNNQENADGDDNINGGDEKKNNDEDEKKNNDDSDEEKDDEEKLLQNLQAEMKTVKKTANYQKMQKTEKYALNDNELMAVIYYCDSASLCSQMKRAHRGVIKNIKKQSKWQKTYYHCTNAIEKMYQVLHYQKKFDNKSQQLYHGSTTKELSVYDRDQWFVKTLTSFSTKAYVAANFAASHGMILIINNAFKGLYGGELRGANVNWLSKFTEYEYIILPTLFRKIARIAKDHGIPNLKREQNVYITSDFVTNKDALYPLPDTVTQGMVSYKGIVSYHAETNNIEGSEEKSRRLLSNFGVPAHYIDNIITNLIKENLIDVEDWQYIVDESEDDDTYLVDTIGFTRAHCKKFRKQYREWMKKQKQ